MYRDETPSTVQRCKINTKILYKLDKYKKECEEKTILLMMTITLKVTTREKLK